MSEKIDNCIINIVVIALSSKTLEEKCAEAESQISALLSDAINHVGGYVGVAAIQLKASLWNVAGVSGRPNGVELVEPFVAAEFNNLPEKSRSVLFQRMLTIVYTAQDAEIKN